MKGCSPFPNAPALLEPHHQIIYIQDTPYGGILPCCRGAVGVFFSPNRQGKLVAVVPVDKKFRE